MSKHGRMRANINALIKGMWQPWFEQVHKAYNIKQKETLLTLRKFATS